MNRAAMIIRLSNEVTALERVAVPTFDEWVKKQTIKSPKTKKPITFKTLERIDPDKAQNIRDQYEAKKEKYEKQQAGDTTTIKRKWFESKKTYEKRLKQNEKEIEQWQKEEMDKHFGDTVKEAIRDAVEEEGILKELEELDTGPIAEMEPANVRILKKSLDKALEGHPKEKVEEYNEIFGDKLPRVVLHDKVNESKKKQQQIKKLMEKAEGLEGGDADKLVREAEKLMEEIDAIDAEVKRGTEFLKQNKQLSALKEQHAGLIDDAWRRHEKAKKEKEEKPTPRSDDPKVVDRVIDELAEAAPAPPTSTRKKRTLYDPDKAKKEKAEKEKAEKEKAKPKKKRPKKKRQRKKQITKEMKDLQESIKETQAILRDIDKDDPERQYYENQLKGQEEKLRDLEAEKKASVQKLAMEWLGEALIRH